MPSSFPFFAISLTVAGVTGSKRAPSVGALAPARRRAGILPSKKQDCLFCRGLGKIGCSTDTRNWISSYLSLARRKGASRRGVVPFDPLESAKVKSIRRGWNFSEALRITVARDGVALPFSRGHVSLEPDSHFTPTARSVQTVHYRVLTASSPRMAFNACVRTFIYGAGEFIRGRQRKHWPEEGFYWGLGGYRLLQFLVWCLRLEHLKIFL